MAGEKMPPSSGEWGLDAKGEVKTWTEEVDDGNYGIIGLIGHIDALMVQDIKQPALAYVCDKQINRLVLDFEEATYIDSELMKLLIEIQMLTGEALKQMSLRNISAWNIRKLLETTALDKRFFIEGEDLPDSPKLKYSQHRPVDHGPA
jgi:anti-anti-sigma regulatory factor